MRTNAYLALAAFAVVAIAAAGPPATAAAPKCPPGKTTNKNVACTDAVKAKGKKAKGGNVEFEWKVEEGEMSKRKKGLKGGN